MKTERFAGRGEASLSALCGGVMAITLVATLILLISQRDHSRQGSVNYSSSAYEGRMIIAAMLRSSANPRLASKST